MKNRILAAYGTSLLGILSGLITNLWLLREVTRAVDPITFGLYALVVQIGSYLAVLQLGLDFATSREIAESLGRGEPMRARNAYWELVRFNRRGSWITGLVVVILAAVLLVWIGFESAATARLAALIALLAGGVQTVAFLSRHYTAALLGSQRQTTVNTITVLRTLGTSALAYLLLRLGLGILCIPIAELVLITLSTLVLSRQADVYCRWRAPRPGAPNRALFKEIARFGGLLSLGGAAWTIESTADVMILGAFDGTGAVAVYVLWWRVPSMVFNICSRLVDSSFPGFAEGHGRSTDEARQLLDKIGHLAIGLATLALVGIALWLPTFIQLWLGTAYALPNGRWVALAMAALVALRALGNLLGVFWLSTGKAQLTTALAVIQALLKVGLGIAMVQHLGILGLILASCVAVSMQVSTLSVFLYRRRFLHWKLVRTGIVLTGVALFFGGFESLLPEPVSLLGFGVGIGLTAALWSVLWAPFAWHATLQVTTNRFFRPRRSGHPVI